ncbi:MAG: formate dehydrogenase [Pseudomonadota bacterium]
MSSKTSSLSRRSLFSGAATVGAVAAATAVLPGVVRSTAPAAAPLPAPARGGGYTLSEHVQQYYKTTRV